MLNTNKNSFGVYHHNNTLEAEKLQTACVNCGSLCNNSVRVASVKNKVAIRCADCDVHKTWLDVSAPPKDKPANKPGRPRKPRTPKETKPQPVEVETEVKSEDTPKLCPACGSAETKVTEGKAPHLATLRCAECDRYLKWIGRKDLEKLNISVGGVA